MTPSGWASCGRRCRRRWKGNEGERADLLHLADARVVGLDHEADMQRLGMFHELPRRDVGLGADVAVLGEDAHPLFGGLLLHRRGDAESQFYRWSRGPTSLRT